ncbi:MAG: hypothetical protein IJC83_03360, partial [Oscillospiraceae bacterium]|nr:hypothetical protein [Oscillospiraceae bacterium]
MAYVLNEKLEKLVPYEPIKGIYPVRLDANESYFNISLSAKMQIIKAISEICFNRYPDPTSYDVCKAFADFYGVDVRKNLIYVTARMGEHKKMMVINLDDEVVSEINLPEIPECLKKIH